MLHVTHHNVVNS